jgi:hypothetical protein
MHQYKCAVKLLFGAEFKQKVFKKEFNKQWVLLNILITYEKLSRSWPPNISIYITKKKELLLGIIWFVDSDIISKKWYVKYHSERKYIRSRHGDSKIDETIRERSRRILTRR